jgi:5-methyltetrahydrofolate--homocysteine methyltransferase
MMLEGAGFEVIDLGTDVPPQKFVAAVLEHKPDILGMSALLTTTTKAMPTTLQALADAGVRDQVKVIIGGAPITDDFAKKIGADGFAADAGSAARAARALMGLV